MTLKLPLGLKSEFRKFCDHNDVSVSFAVASYMKRTLAESKVIDYRAFTALRHKPKKKTLS
jgi:hypothetical protein